MNNIIINNEYYDDNELLYSLTIIFFLQLCLNFCQKDENLMTGILINCYEFIFNINPPENVILHQKK